VSKYDLYDFTSSGLAHSYKWHLPMVENVILESNAASVFEVGCGNGSLGKHIMSKYELDYQGMDSSSKGIERAKENGKFDDKFLLGDVTHENKNLGGCYDLCISIDVIEHVVDLSGYLTFIKQRLKPDGVVFISTTYHSYLKWLLLAIFGKMSSHVDPLWPGGRCKFFSKKDLLELFTQHGFVVDVATSGLRLNGPVIPSSFYVTAKLVEKGV